MHETLVARPQAPVAPETVTPIKPSEALRLGRLTRPRALRGALFQGTGAACALGAIITGYGGREGDSYDYLAHKYPLINRKRAACPDAACETGRRAQRRGGYPALDVVYHLNDDHEWSDDQIVTWLESLGL